MVQRWLLPFLCLGLAFLAGCGQVPVSPTAVPLTAAPPAADPFARPEMAVQGELAGGIPFGITADGHYFKGSPDAPVVLFEFSDYQ